PIVGGTALERHHVAQILGDFVKRLLRGTGVTREITLGVLAPIGPKVLKIELPGIDARHCRGRSGARPRSCRAAAEAADLDDLATLAHALRDALDDLEIALAHPAGNRQIVGHARSLHRGQGVERDVDGFVEAPRLVYGRSLEEKGLEQTPRLRTEVVGEASAAAMGHPASAENQPVVDVRVLVDELPPLLARHPFEVAMKAVLPRAQSRIARRSWIEVDDAGPSIAAHRIPDVGDVVVDSVA